MMMTEEASRFACLWLSNLFLSLWATRGRLTPASHSQQQCFASSVRTVARPCSGQDPKATNPACDSRGLEQPLVNVHSQKPPFVSPTPTPPKPLRTISYRSLVEIFLDFSASSINERFSNTHDRCAGDETEQGIRTPYVFTVNRCRP